MSKLEYDKQQKFNQLIRALRTGEPVLTDPTRLTDDIMEAVRERQKIPQAGKSSFVLVQKLLIAASVCLLLTLGFDEFVFLHKVKSLEAQTSSLSDAGDFHKGLRGTLSLNAGLNSKALNEIWNGNDPRKLQPRIRMRLKFARLSLYNIRGLEIQQLSKLNEAVQYYGQ